jgi:hypothetical protein
MTALTGKQAPSGENQPRFDPNVNMVYITREVMYMSLKRSERERQKQETS